MLFRAGDVPLDRDPAGRFLPWLVAVIVYLAALALISALTMSRTIEHWQEGLSGTLTIQVPWPEQDPAKAAPDTLGRILDLLLATPGVREAKVLEPDEIERLLRPWLGSAAGWRDLPMPSLITVSFDAAAEPDLAALARGVAKIAPDAAVDTHRTWLGRVRGLARTLQWIAVLAVVLICGCAVIIVAFATRMGLSVHRPVIQLLHLIGAHDSYVAKQFQAHALRFALRGGIAGVAMAAATLLLAGQSLKGSTIPLMPSLALQPLDWSALLLLPVFVALVATLTARITVMRTLGRMP